MNFDETCGVYLDHYSRVIEERLLVPLDRFDPSGIYIIDSGNPKIQLFFQTIENQIRSLKTNTQNPRAQSEATALETLLTSAKNNKGRLDFFGAAQTVKNQPAAPELWNMIVKNLKGQNYIQYYRPSSGAKPGMRPGQPNNPNNPNNNNSITGAKIRQIGKRVVQAHDQAHKEILNAFDKSQNTIRSQ